MKDFFKKNKGNCTNEVKPVGAVVPAAYRKGGFVVSEELPSAHSGLEQPPRISRNWKYANFDSNQDARDFLNKLGVEPFAIYPGSNGEITVWYFNLVTL